MRGMIEIENEKLQEMRDENIKNIWNLLSRAKLSVRQIKASPSQFSSSPICIDWDKKSQPKSQKVCLHECYSE